MKTGNEFSFHINGTKIFRQTIDGFDGGAIGLYVNNQFSITFDNFTITSADIFEDFNSGSGGFSEDESFSVSDGRYLFKGDGTDSSQIKVWAGGSDPGGWNPQPDNSNYFQDFLVSADTFRESGADNVDYGLAVCTHQNTGGTADYVRLRIAGAGYYKIDKRVGDAFENIADWTESPLINKGTGSKNRLSVMKTGSDFTFHINGTKIFRQTIDGFDGGAIGLYVNNQLSISFDNFTITSARDTLELESVYPALGELGQTLKVTLTGTGFDQKTKVSIYPDSGNERMIRGSLKTTGMAMDVTVAGNTAYLADGIGLKIIDVTIPSAPRQIGTVDTPDDAYGIAVSGNTVYVADNEKGLQIIDASNPNAPRIIGNADTPGNAYGVAVSGKIAYVADNKSGLQIISINDPYHPQVIGSVAASSKAYDVAVSGNTVYLADNDKGLQIIDVSDPYNPYAVSGMDELRGADAVAVSGSIVYISTEISTEDDEYIRSLNIIDVSNLKAPKIIGKTAFQSWETSGYGSVTGAMPFAYGLTVLGNRAYMTDKSGLKIIDVSNPDGPIMLTTVNTPGFAYGIAVSDTTAYIADACRGLHIADISNISESPVIGRLDTSGTTHKVVVSGDKAYIINMKGGLEIADIKDPSNPEIIGSVDTSDAGNGIAISDNIVCVAAGDSGLHVINVNDPANPVVTTLNTPGRALDVVVSGTTAYVADCDGGLQIVSIENPLHPEIIGSLVDEIEACPALYKGGFFEAHFDTECRVTNVAVSGNTAYVLNPGNLITVDVSNPSAPAIIGTLDTRPGNARGIEIAGNIAYVAVGFDGSTSGLEVIDVSDPSHPKIVGFISTGGDAYNVSVSNGIAYVSHSAGIYLTCLNKSNLQAIDVSDPTNPILIGTFDTPGNFYDAAIVGDIAYLTNGSYGMAVAPLPKILPFTLNSDTSISLTIPSPMVAGHYTLRVFNGSEYDELHGAVTFSESEKYEELRRQKAIIVAGSSSYPDDYLWKDTWLCTTYAYRSLLSQGYTRDSIYFLSPEKDFDGDRDGLFNDVDGDATAANLLNALTVWAADAGEVLLYMSDHGGQGSFQLNKNEFLRVETLNVWLNTLQNTMSGRVIFIYDACMSGSFVSLLKPPPGKERVVIASSSADSAAYFENSGMLSFSYQFWSYIFLDANLYRAFDRAAQMMKEKQIAMLDANGDGIGYSESELDVPKEDKYAAKAIVISRGWVAASVQPVIKSVSKAQTLNGETAASFSAGDITALNGIKRVWAVILAPGYRYAPSDQPVTELPSAELKDSDGDGVYEGIYNGFTVNGTYKIIIYAEDAEGMYSLPAYTDVVQTGMSEKKGDLDGDQRITLKDAVTALKLMSGISVNLPVSLADADVNNDGRIGAAEAVYILRRIAG